MTICIAAIADNYNAVVVAADRMVTSTTPLYVEFEHHMPKIHNLSENCIAMTAGDALAYSELFSEYKKTKGQSTVYVSAIVEEIKDIYWGKREKRIIDEVLRTRGFKSIDDFYAGKERVPPDIFYVIDRDIITYDYELQLIVSGIDDEGSHIYGIDNPGTHRCHDSIGYYIIGSGVQHALASFISHGYTSSCSLNKAIYYVFEAKIFAEEAPGVGKECDMKILTKKGIRAVSDKELHQLKDIYDKVTLRDLMKEEELLSSLPFEKELK